MVVRNVRVDEGRALLEMLDALRQGAQGSSAITVRILAAADHDGVCATKILVTLLQKNGVKYAVVPVTANTDIVDHLKQLEEDTEVRSLVLLNCGASLDLQQQLEECNAPLELRCFVIDAHRPFLLANLSNRHTRVIVLDDDPIAEASGMRPPVDDAEGDISDDSDEGAPSDGGDSEAEKENQWDLDVAGNRKESTVERRERKRKRLANRQAKMERKRQRINEYYLTSYCATPAAMSLFKMARQSAPPSQDLLWLAAVSLVGYQDQGLVSEVEYNRLAWEELKEALDHTADMAFSSAAGSGDSTVPDAPSDDEDLQRPRRHRNPPRSLTQQGRRRLRFETDLRLTLYKHWTLEESMMHSAYFYGTLELHRDKGLRSLKNFFATAGIPPSDYRQMHSGMQIPIRKTIHKKFREHGKAYGMTESKMFLQQFVRDLGPLGDACPALMLHELSCLDAAQIINATLSSVPPSLSGSRLENLPRTAEGLRDVVAINDMERSAMVENFWRAFDAVLCKEPGPLRDGIADAVEVAKAVQSQARLIKDTKAMHISRQFRWCKIERPPHFFRHPLAVRKLAVWLLQVLFSYRPKGEGPDRPLLVIVRDQVRDTYLCVGATPSRFSEQDEFGHLFRNVLRTDRTLKYRYDFFDKSCIEIQTEDFDRFWELLMNE